MIWAAAILAVALAAGIVDSRQRSISRLLKMAASSGVIASLIMTNHEASAYGWLILGALVASWIGDLALSFPSRSHFVVGLLAFAVAHMIYATAFLVRSSVIPAALGFASVAMVIIGWLVYRWVSPHTPQALLHPLAGYIGIISVMVITAFAAQGEMTNALIPLGSVAFAASDLLVARERFVSPSRWNRIIGLPLYFTAQLLFVSTV